MIYYKKSNLWLPPVLGALIAIIVAVGALYLDHYLDWKDPGVPFFKGDLDTAHSLLSVIATSVTTLLALIFTIIVVAIQLASSQYTPRALATLLQDRPSHITIGIFVGTFTYTLMILWGLRFTETENGENVGGVSLSLALIFAIVSLGNFAIYSNHIIHSVRVTSLINRVASETRRSIKKVYSKGNQYAIKICEIPTIEPDHIIYSDKVGVVVAVQTEKLFKHALTTDAVLVIDPIAGAFVPEGYPLIKIYGKKPEAKLVDHIQILGERTMDMNILFGLRQLSDMAIRANSPGINDPASAVQVIDQLHDLLRRLIKIDMGHLVVEDKNGNTRVFMKLPSWDDVVHVAIDEVRNYGASSLQVVRRMRAMLENLLQEAPDEKKNSIKIQLELLDKTVDENFDHDYLVDLAKRGDIRGDGF